MDRLLHDLRVAYASDIVATGRETQFLVLAAFLVTFATVRGVVHAIRRRGERPGRRLMRNVQLGTVHVHHLVPGIILLLATGYLGIVLDAHRDRRLIAALFGVGAALTLDEFALWLHLEDVYWDNQGRKSVDVVLFAAGLAGLVMLGLGFWLKVARALGHLVS